MKDERISALLDSNNELTLDLTEKNQTIQKFKIALSKFHAEREEYRKTSAGQPETTFLKFFSSKSTETSPILDSKNDLSSSFEGQKQTIQKLENEIQILKDALSSASKNVTQTGQNEAEKLENTERLLMKTDMIYSSPLERAVQTANAFTGSTTGSETAVGNQNGDHNTETTSLTSNISRQQISKLLHNIHNWRQRLLAKQFKHLREIYQADFDYVGAIAVPKSSEVALTENEWKKLTTIHERFETMLAKFISAKEQSPNVSSSKVPVSRDQVTDTEDLVKSSNHSHIDDMQQVHSEIFAQLESKVKSTLNFEIDAAIKKSTESFKNLHVTCNRPDQTNIEELEKKLASKDNLISDLSKRMTEVQTGLGKQISDGLSKIQLLNAKNAEAETKLTHERSVKNAAHLKVREIDEKLKESDKLLKSKVSEISQLQKRVSNQTKTNSQQQQAMNLKCKEIERLQKDLNKFSGQQTSQAEVNKLKTKIRQVFQLINNDLSYK